MRDKYTCGEYVIYFLSTYLYTQAVRGAGVQGGCEELALGPGKSQDGINSYSAQEGINSKGNVTDI